MTFGQPTTIIAAKASDADALERRRAARACDWTGLGVDGATAELRRILVSVRVLLATVSAALLLTSAASHGLAQALASLGFAAYAPDTSPTDRTSRNTGTNRAGSGCAVGQYPQAQVCSILVV